jgi:hypothetical protein
VTLIHHTLRPRRGLTESHVNTLLMPRGSRFYCRPPSIRQFLACIDGTRMLRTILTERIRPTRFIAAPRTLPR